MTLESHRELELAREKLRSLEEHYEQVRQKPAKNEHLRQLTLRSLRQFMNQLNEEITRFESHAAARTGRG